MNHSGARRCLIILVSSPFPSGAGTSTGSPEPSIFLVGRSWMTFPSISCSQVKPCDWVVAKEWGQKWLVHLLSLPLTKKTPYASSRALSSLVCQLEGPRGRPQGLRDGKVTRWRSLGPWKTAWSGQRSVPFLALYNLRQILMRGRDKPLLCYKPH